MKQDIIEIQECEICGNQAIPTVLDLGLQPLCDDLVAKGYQESVRKYPTEICYCNVCFTAHQRYQVSKEILFKPSYHYRASLTKDVLSGMQDFVTSCEEVLGPLTGKSVIDIGCNDGSLLKFFKNNGCYTMGVEPTDAIEESSQIDHSVRGFFDLNIAQKCNKILPNPDMVTFTNVFAHIENLKEMLSNVKKICSSNTLLVIENHYLGSVLSNFQFDTFYHEHPRTYSFNSFKYIAAFLGMNIVKVQFPSRYGGNIRVFLSYDTSLGSISEEETQEILTKENKFEFKIKEIQAFIQRWQVDFKDQLIKLKAEGKKVVGKAFPARASIIINLLGIDKTLIPEILEQPNSPKLGYLVPGSNIEIVSDEKINNYDTVINFAWHINEEITLYLKKNGFCGEIIPVLSIANE